MNKCGNCKHFTGAGDFDLCCMKSMRRLCYKDNDACDAWEENPVKHTYYVVMDGQVIARHNDKVGIHPVCIINLMGQELSERMEKANKDYWTDALEEAKEELK